MNENAERLRRLAAARRAAVAQLPENSPRRQVALDEAARLVRQADELEQRADRDPRHFHDDTAPRKPSRRPRDKGRALTASQVAEIIKETAAGIRHAEIGKRYRVHPDTISRIARGETWRHVAPGQNRGRSQWPGHKRNPWREIE